ncbi:hypothetical protein [Streptomyces sp. NPDC002403]
MTVVVRDYEAIAFFQDIVGFDLLEDIRIKHGNLNSEPYRPEISDLQPSEAEIGDARGISAR